MLAFPDRDDEMAASDGRPSLVMLGLIAGIDEVQIHQLMESGKGEDLITAVRNIP
jgi:hypothetical protein